MHGNRCGELWWIAGRLCPGLYPETGNGRDSSGASLVGQGAPPPLPLCFLWAVPYRGWGANGCGGVWVSEGTLSSEKYFFGEVAGGQSRGFPLGIPADSAALAHTCSGALLALAPAGRYERLDILRISSFISINRTYPLYPLSLCIACM